jgi:hypothetical protein
MSELVISDNDSSYYATSGFYVYTDDEMCRP